MLTRKQHELLSFIQVRLEESGISPSFEEMKEALDLKSKSGVHRLISALEERGFIRRLPTRLVEAFRSTLEETVQADLLLADFGAEVIKVENIKGDIGRNLNGKSVTPGMGAKFLHLNRNKRSMTLNLKKPGALEVLMRLVAEADVVVENWRPDVKNKLGLDYESLAKVNPRIILASISGFGQDGPYAHAAGYDFAIQATGGLMSVTGEKDGTPFARDKRALVYQRAKQALDKRPFGTQYNVYEEQYEWLHHSLAPTAPLPVDQMRVQVGSYSASLLNISAMSYGALSANAIRALNKGAKAGGFFHDTGEGGVSPYHREHGGDLVWEIGSGYFGCRDAQGHSVAVEIKRRGEIDGVEQLTRYLELLNRDPLLAPVRGVFAAQEIKPQARVLAGDRGIECVVLDYDAMRGLDDVDSRLF